MPGSYHSISTENRVVLLPLWTLSLSYNLLMRTEPPFFRFSADSPPTGYVYVGRYLLFFEFFAYRGTTFCIGPYLSFGIFGAALHVHRR